MRDKAIGLHKALRQAEVPHAFGGALALAYYAEPRATADVDLNVFLPPSEWPRVREVLAALGADVDAARFEGSDQVRVPWDGTELHLFFSVDELHEAMAGATRTVTLDGATVPLIAPEHLVVRKLLLDREKDHADVAAIRATTPLDETEIDRWLDRLSS